MKIPAFVGKVMAQITAPRLIFAGSIVVLVVLYLIYRSL